MTAAPTVKAEVVKVEDAKVVVREAAAAIGAIRTRGATAQETVVTAATATAVMNVVGDVTVATAMIDSAEKTVVEGDDETVEEEAGVEDEEEAISARSRPRPSRRPASLPPT